MATSLDCDKGREKDERQGSGKSKERSMGQDNVQSAIRRET